MGFFFAHAYCVPRSLGARQCVIGCPIEEAIDQSPTMTGYLLLHVACSNFGPKKGVHMQVHVGALDGCCFRVEPGMMVETCAALAGGSKDPF